MLDQMNIWGENRPCECCYTCNYFSEFKEPRTYIERDLSYTVFGVCLKRFGKNSIYTVLPVYVPGGKCKDFNKIKGEISK